MKLSDSKVVSSGLVLSWTMFAGVFATDGLLDPFSAQAANEDKLALSTTLQPSSPPTAGSLLATIPGGKQVSYCPLQHTDVSATVSGYISRVTVTQKFHNSNKNKIDALYSFPLPENAAVDKMTIKIGSRVIRGHIKKREEAKAIYQLAREQGYAAALLDQERPNVFTQSVANIEPGETICVEISYVELLKYDGGTFTFTFPTVVGPRFNPRGSHQEGKYQRLEPIEPNTALPFHRAGHDISISVDINAGVPAKDINSKLHRINVTHENPNHIVVSLAKNDTIPNRDFVLNWTVASDKLISSYLTHKDDKSGYFTLMLLPPNRVTPRETTPKEMIFLIDCSGSQSGAPLQKAKETLSYVLDHMNPNDTFQIIAFSDQARRLGDKPQLATPEMRKRASEFIENLQADGGTWMASAVMQACSLPHEENRLRIVTFMTDGYVGNDFEILELIKNFRGDSRWFSFGTGNGVNRFLIDNIAKEGGGEADYVLLTSSPAEVGRRFYDRISSPVLTNVKLAFEGVEVKDIYPNVPADVWASRPLFIQGRYSKPGSGSVTLSGIAGGKPYTQTMSLNFPENQPSNDAVKSLWARSKVDRLMSANWFAIQQGTISPDARNEIIQTALDHQLMTQYTSFVAVDESHVTKAGKAQTLNIPVEAPDGVAVEQGGGGSGWYTSSPASPPTLGSMLRGDAAGHSSMAKPDVDFGPYMADIQRRAKKQWFPPRGQESHRPVVTFTIHKNGSVSNLHIARSSGVASADQCALQAIRTAAPFRPLPSGSPNQVDIEFTFDYNIFGSAGNQTITKLDDLLRESLSSMKAHAEVETNQAGELKVKVKLSDTNAQTLTKLAKAKFTRSKLMGNSITGTIKLENLHALCSLPEVESITALKKSIDR